MDDRSIREKLTRAMAEPKAPEALIRQTIVRTGAVRDGLRAEEKLESDGSSLSPGERRELAAKSVVGRLMQNVRPPDGVTAERMTKQLMDMPAFRKLAEQPADRLLSDIRLGRVNRILASSGSAPEKSTDTPMAAPAPRKREGPKL